MNRETRILACLIGMIVTPVLVSCGGGGGDAPESPPIAQDNVQAPAPAPTPSPAPAPAPATAHPPSVLVKGTPMLLVLAERPLRVTGQTCATLEVSEVVNSTSYPSIYGFMTQRELLQNNQVPMMALDLALRPAPWRQIMWDPVRHVLHDYDGSLGPYPAPENSTVWHQLGPFPMSMQLGTVEVSVGEGNQTLLCTDATVSGKVVHTERYPTIKAMLPFTAG